MSSDRLGPFNAFVGTWSGEGEGIYPTLATFAYREQTTFTDGGGRATPAAPDRRVASLRLTPDTLWGMCRRTTCRKCGKPSWAGCGAHVEVVLGDVPKSERCRCHETPRVAAGKSTVKSHAAPESRTTVEKFKAWLKQ